MKKILTNEEEALLGMSESELLTNINELLDGEDVILPNSAVRADDESYGEFLLKKSSYLEEYVGV